MLRAVEQLKEVVHKASEWKVQSPLAFFPDPDLLCHVRSAMLDHVRQLQNQKRDLDLDFLLEDFNEGLFDVEVQAAARYLQGLGVVESADLRRHLARAAIMRVDRILRFANYSEHCPIRDVDDLLCRGASWMWDEGGTDLFVFQAMARQRSLVAFDYEREEWHATGLGRFFLSLPAMQAVMFLLCIDLRFSRGSRDLRYVSYDTIKQLRDDEDVNKLHVPAHASILRSIGVLRDWWDQRGGRRDVSVVTPMGRRVLAELSEDSHPMLAAVDALVSAEQSGEHHDRRYVSQLRATLGSCALDEGIKNTIMDATLLYEQGRYVSSARTLFPSLEAIATAMLLHLGEPAMDVSQFPGLAKKLARLEQLGSLPADLTRSIDVAFARNKILHGQYSPLDQELANPLCIAAALFVLRTIRYHDQMLGARK